jgi:DNA polymerase III delta prime subunit
MDNLNINNLLNRDEEANKIKMILKDFEQNKHNLTTKRGLYIYGDPGSGKTTFILNILKEINYDVIKYDAGDVRNKSIIDTITKHNMSDRNIISMFEKKVKRIAIIMDEIDGMNNGDKGGINSLIKIIRPKKTKKQKLEETTLNPIICIGNYHIDKKIKELMKVCHVIELKSPNKQQILLILKKIIPSFILLKDEEIKTNIINYIQYDLRKLKTIYELSKNNDNILNNNSIKNIFLQKSYNDDTRKITKKLINNNYPIEDHLTIMNETDRTIVGLLWHENIIDVLEKTAKEESIPFYSKGNCFIKSILIEGKKQVLIVGLKKMINGNTIPIIYLYDINKHSVESIFPKQSDINNFNSFSNYTFKNDNLPIVNLVNDKLYMIYQTEQGTTEADR